MSVVLAPPELDASSYRDLLGDIAFWAPYANAALRRSGLPGSVLTSGFTGTYPTMLGDTFVVKLFGFFGDWRRSAETEITANLAVRADPLILAPTVLATGRLFAGAADDWPYLISSRLAGRPWRDAALSGRERALIARQVGEQIRRVHDLPLPLPGRLHPDWLLEARSSVVERQRRWGSLPGRLIDQLPGYLDDCAAVGSRPARSLVHADLTEDHLFVDGGRLIGIIDWGDAMVTDPYYELAALHLDAFGADRRLLGHFLDGCRWAVTADFARHALQAALLHQFDLLAPLTHLVRRVDSLTELADALFTPIGVSGPRKDETR